MLLCLSTDARRDPKLLCTLRRSWQDAWQFSRNTQSQEEEDEEEYRVIVVIELLV